MCGVDPACWSQTSTWGTSPDRDNRPAGGQLSWLTPLFERGRGARAGRKETRWVAGLSGPVGWRAGWRRRRWRWRRATHLIYVGGLILHQLPLIEPNKVDSLKKNRNKRRCFYFWRSRRGNTHRPTVNEYKTLVGIFFDTPDVLTENPLMRNKYLLWFKLINLSQVTFVSSSWRPETNVFELYFRESWKKIKQQTCNLKSKHTKNNKTFFNEKNWILRNVAKLLSCIEINYLFIIIFIM